MTDPRSELGLGGERLAEAFLTKRGLRTVARRYATKAGELDLVMRDGDTIVFVEVKTRRDRRLADPQDAINLTKQRKLIRAARWFLHQRKCLDKPCRFDIVAVVMPEAGGEPQVEHIPDAFVPDRW